MRLLKICNGQLFSYLTGRDCPFKNLSMKVISIFCIAFCINLTAYSQAWVWEKSINTTSNSIATDLNNNIIVLAANGNATQLSKFTKDGLLLWSKQLTKLGAFTPSGSVVADKNGNIYTFTEGFDSINHQFAGVKPTGITKFGPNGNVLWHKYYSAAGNKLAIQIDGNNDVYVGYFLQAGNQPVTIMLGDSTRNIVNERYYLSVGSISSSGIVKWVRGFIFHVFSGTSNLCGTTSISLAGNTLFVSGWSTNIGLLLDNGLVLNNNRCSAWLAAFDCATGQSKWGNTHNLFYFCAGSACGCCNPSINGSTSYGKIALANNLNGAFVFKPLDTIASITATGQTAVKSYYTIYDTLGNPVKGKTIEDMPNIGQYNEILAGSRNNFYFVHFSNSNPAPGFRDTLRKVDTGFNLIWKATLPAAVEKIFIPQNTNDIIATYSRAGVVYLAKMVDSAAIISGRTYADWDNNGIYTTADSALGNILITTNSPVANSISSADSGKYYMYASPATYILNANFNNPFYQFLPANQSAIVNQISDTINGKDFRLRPLFSFTDVSVNFSALNIARPGRPAYYTVTVKNFSATAAAMEVGLKLPSLALYTGINGGAVTVNAPDSITIAMGNVNPFETKQAILLLNIAATATLNDTLKYYPKAYPYTADTIKRNNLDTLIQNIRTSFDPNEKEVNVKGRLLTDSSNALVYTIHFQNTGTDTAFYVRIADTLPASINANTFNFIDASHAVTTEIKNNIINFVFNPVFLPDSNHNELQSHGFVKFKVKAISSLGIADTIYNKAAIYFDYNTPVLTGNAKSWYLTGIALPVTLQTFTANKKEASVVLKFTTATETDITSFIIERSIDGISFNPVGTVNANGNTATGNVYLFEDYSPNKGINFYRLKIVDKNLKNSYSWVLVVKFSKDSQQHITAFPNPANDNLYISLRDITAGQKIFACSINDAAGKIVWAATINTNLRDTYSVNTAVLPSGIYFITVTNKDAIYHQKVAVKH
jgi:hypothetical protein